MRASVNILSLFSLSYLGYSYYNDDWEKNHESEDHVNDPRRMDRLHDEILAESHPNIFIVRN
jgi:hypothetical protein